jgi:fatty-acyl-CoA synthase
MSDIAAFSRRFGCTGDRQLRLVGRLHHRAAHAGNATRGPWASGRQPVRSVVLNPESGAECPRAVFDARWRADERQRGHRRAGEPRRTRSAVRGLLEQPGGPTSKRLRNGARTGAATWPTATKGASSTLPGATANGCASMARTSSAIQIEQVLARHPLDRVAAVYGVPDPLVGDRVMAALQLTARCPLRSCRAIRALSSQRRPTSAASGCPAFVRIAADAASLTATNKVLKRELQRAAWNCADTVWWQPVRAGPYRRLSAADAEELRRLFVSRGRGHLLRIGGG